MMSADVLSQNELHAATVRRGRLLEYFTIGWNVLEAVFAIGAGVFAGSVALIGFGLCAARFLATRKSKPAGA